MAFKSDGSVVVESVFFNGYKYNRYPESKNPAHRRYFARAGHRLHRDVWEYHNGPIPEGYQIHHVDGDTANNDIANLECMPRKRHREEHAAAYAERGRSEKQVAHLAAIRASATEWHRSEEGREWHKEHAQRTLRRPGAAKPYSKSRYQGACEWCGSPFEARSPRKTLCSNKCACAKSKYLLGKIRKPHQYFASRLQHDG